MDKNIAAILREDTCTVVVRFQSEKSGSIALGKSYTYVTDFPVDVDDLVVVMVGERFEVCTVVEVHPDLQIEPNADMHYKWLVCKVDRARFDENIVKNEQIAKTVGRAYQTQVRRAFASTILQGLPEEARTQLAQITGGKS